MEKLDSKQTDQLKAIGSYLAQIREQQSITLEEISSRTYIPLRLLRALETGQQSILPEPVYIQGFIRRYADALGLDGIGISKEFPTQSSPVVQELTVDETSITAPPPPPAKTSEASLSSWNPRLVYSALLIFIFIGIAGAVIYQLSRLSNSPLQASSPPVSEEPIASPADTPSPNPAASEPSASSSSVAPIAVESSPSVSPSAIAPSVSDTATSDTGSLELQPSLDSSPSDSPLTVAINLSDRSWLRIEVDGNVEFEGILPQGTRQAWSASEEITIRAGNAGAVMVSNNQGTFTPMGAVGQVQEQTFTPTTTPTTTDN